MDVVEAEIAPAVVSCVCVSGVFALSFDWNGRFCSQAAVRRPKLQEIVKTAPQPSVTWSRLSKCAEIRKCSATALQLVNI